MFGTMNFRKKLLITIIPLAILSIGALITISYLKASDAILDREHELMKRLVQTAQKELSKWVDERSEKRLSLAITGCFKPPAKETDWKRPKND